MKESREREARERGGRREGESSGGGSSRIANLRKEVNDDEGERGSRRRLDPGENRRQSRGNEPELVEVSVVKRPPP